MSGTLFIFLLNILIISFSEQFHVIRNKHNFASCQPIITNLLSLLMFSTSTFHLRAFPESHGGYTWEKVVYTYPEAAQQPF